jgi:hypothetical protein
MEVLWLSNKAQDGATPAAHPSAATLGPAQDAPPPAAAGGGGYSGGGCERECVSSVPSFLTSCEHREVGKRRRCEGQVASEQVRNKVLRYKRMADREGGSLGELLEVQVGAGKALEASAQEKATKYKRDRDNYKRKTDTQENRNIETLRTNTHSMEAHAGRRNNIDRCKQLTPPPPSPLSLSLPLPLPPSLPPSRSITRSWGP